MLRHSLLAATLVAVAAFAFADDAKKEDKSNLADKVKDLSLEMKKSASDAIKSINAEKDKTERTKLIAEYQKIPATYAPKFLALAKSNPKDPAAFDAALLAFRGTAKVSEEAIGILVDNFIDDERMVGVLSQLAGSDAGQKALATIGEKAKSKAVRGQAQLAVVQHLVESTDYPRTGKRLPADEAAKNFAKAGKQLKTLASEYGEEKVVLPRDQETSVAAECKKLDFFLNNLIVGKKAPVVEVAALEGEKKAKLSDYKGKVVVLDVWATWCGPCIAMIPHEREMVKKLKDKPFALISVSADEKKETLTKFLAKTEMPWTHWWDGRGGKFAETYQIRFFPTIYVIDGEGVIRDKHVRGEALEKSVEKLLDETKKAESK